MGQLPYPEFSWRLGGDRSVAATQSWEPSKLSAFTLRKAVNVPDAPIIALPVAIEKHRLWSRLRIDASRTRRTLAWWQMVDAWAEEARKVIQPLGTFRFFELQGMADNEVFLSEGIRLRYLRQTRLLKNAERIALCGVTIGARLEKLSNSLATGGDLAEASLLSMIGDCALAEGQVKLQNTALERLGSALSIGVALQPGAQYWDIQGNTVFFEVLPLESMGVSLLDSYALSPGKSKTFACVFTARQP